MHILHKHAHIYVIVNMSAIFLYEILNFSNFTSQDTKS
jgi:hypothetical protein